MKPHRPLSLAAVAAAAEHLDATEVAQSKCPRQVGAPRTVVQRLEGLRGVGSSNP